MRSELDDMLIARYCVNPDCPSFGKKRKGQGRFLAKTRIGDPVDLLCEDCHQVQEIRPFTGETVKHRLNPGA